MPKKIPSRPLTGRARTGDVDGASIAEPQPARLPGRRVREPRPQFSKRTNCAARNLSNGAGTLRDDELPNTVSPDGTKRQVDRRRLVSLEADGPIKKALGRGRGAMIAILEMEIKEIREQYEGMLDRMPDSEGKDGLFRRVVSGRFSDNDEAFPIEFDLARRRDRVLLWMIARLEGLDGLSKELIESARNAFLQRPFDYDDAFGELLPKEFQDILRRIGYAKGSHATAAEDFDVFNERLESLRGLVAVRGTLGMPTGLPKLDGALCGLRGTTFLAAHKGAGKTSLMLSAVLATLKTCDDVAVMVLSFDEPKDRLYQRLLCMEADVGFRQLLDPDAEIRRRLEEGKQRLSVCLPRLRIVERCARYLAQREPTSASGSGAFDLQALAADWRILQEATGATQLLLCVDLFQKWPTSLDDAADQADHFRLDVVDQFRRSSVSPSCPDGHCVLILSEIRKDAPRELDINDLKGNGRMTSDADTVLLLYKASDRLNADANTVPMMIRVAKGRDGVDRVDLPVWFDFARFRFLDDDPKQRDVQSSAASPDEHPRSHRRGSTRRSHGPDPLAT
jgi:hypothetical protein